MLTAASRFSSRAGRAGARPIPFNVLAFIRGRATGQFEAVATELAERLMAVEELELRPQNSKGEPWYFQVRSPRFRQVLAYVNVSPQAYASTIACRKDHDTVRSCPRSRQLLRHLVSAHRHHQLDFAMKLVMDAIAQPIVFDVPAELPAVNPTPASPALIKRAYDESPPAMKRFLEYLTDQADRPIPNDEVAEGIGLSRPQLTGMLGAFGRRWANRYQMRNAKWFFDAEWAVDAKADIGSGTTACQST